MCSATTAYDRILYPSRALVQTHPDRLAVMGTLFGMNPAAAQRCRVLEIGCSEGSNLIPLAFSLPESSFIGIDRAARPIEMAQAMIERAQLHNVRVECMDLMDISPDFGEFDYIIAHGFYAWVPPEVQQKLLSVCSQNLAPNGIAFVSYNAYPGCYARHIFRDMMLFLTQGMEDSTQRVQQGMAFIRFMLESMEDPPARGFLLDEFARMCERDETMIYHDELAPTYSPLYFSDFIAAAGREGLQFLSEARLLDLIVPTLKPDVAGRLLELAGENIVAYQQFLDFVRLRSFRQTLLCHDGVPLQRDQMEQHVKQLWVASPLKRTASAADGILEFKAEGRKGTIKTSDPITLALLARLEEIWPRAEQYADVLGAIRSRIPAEQLQRADDVLPQTVLRLAAHTLIDLRSYALPLAQGVTERPKASRLARLQALHGNMVTTPLHTMIEIKDEGTRTFLQSVDGTRDRRALVDVMAKQNSELARATIEHQVEENLHRLHQMGLLVE
jgi:methyltransferase-like protein